MILMIDGVLTFNSFVFYKNRNEIAICLLVTKTYLNTIKLITHQCLISILAVKVK